MIDLDLLLSSRSVAKFAWWDDAVSHARWLAQLTGRRYRVYRPRGHVAWRVCVAIVTAPRNGGGSTVSSPGLVRVETECDGCRTKVSLDAVTVTDGQHELEARGWLRNHKLDQDLCPTCALARVGFYGVDRRLL